MSNEFRTLAEKLAPYVIDYAPMPMEYACDPSAVSVYVLLKQIMHGGLGKQSTIAAIKEYNERLWGKSKSKLDVTMLKNESLDLTVLTEVELETLTRLLEKAQRKELQE